MFATLSGLVLFAACGSGKDINVESVLPEDSGMVFVLDYSAGDQIDKFKNLLDKFPETDIFDKILEEYKNTQKEDEPSYEKDIKPILDSEWKVVVGLNFNKEVASSEDFSNLQPGDVGVFVAGEFAEADKVEELTNTYGDGLKYKEDDNVKYWTDEASDVYLARYEDVFFITNTESGRIAALDRLESGEIEFKSQMENLPESNMGYLFLDFGRLGPLFKELYTSMGYGSIVNYFDAMGNVYVTWLAENDGIKIVSNAKISDAGAFVTDPDYKVSLIENIPADGVFFYTEQSGLGPSFEAFISGFLAGYNGALRGESGVNLDEGEKLYQGFLADSAAAAGISVAEIEGLLNSPFAFAMSDIGAYYPTAALYIKLGEDSVESAKKLNAVLDSYIDDMIVELDALLTSQGSEVSGLLKRDIELVGGGGLHKVYVDWKALSPELLAQVSAVPGFDITKTPIELYYGVTGDNMLVIAFYPDFAAAYDNEPLAEDEVYSEAVDKLGENYGYAVSYFRTQPLIDLFTRYFDIAKNTGFVSEIDEKDYDLYVNQLIATFKYLISSAKLDGENLRSNAFVGIEKVEAGTK